MVIQDNSKPYWVDLIERKDGCYLVCHHCGADFNLGQPHISEALAECREHVYCQPRRRGMVRMKGVKT